MSDDAITVDIRTRGGARSAAEIKTVADAIGAVQDAQGRWRDAKGKFISVQRQEELGLRESRRQLGLLGSAYTVAGKGVSNFRQNVQLGTMASNAMRRSAYAAGATLAYVGAAAVKTGLDFNASQEQSEVAFTQFLGSARAARQEMAFLRTTAAHTPFELTNIVPAARRLLAYNFSLRATNGWLGTIGDTIAGMGGGAEEIDSLVRAIGQIQSKGVLQGDEMMQLSELGVLNRRRLAKDLGVTPEVLMSGRANISARDALRALKKQLDDTFGGQSAKQARTFNGQLSTLHDNLSQTLGKATWPLFTELRDEVLPGLNDAAEGVGKIFDRKDLTLGQKLAMSRAEVDRELGPTFDAIKAELGQAHIPEKLGEEFGKAVPMVAAELAHAGPPAAVAFAKAFIHSGPMGQLFTVGWMAQQAGAFSALGNVAAKRFEERFVKDSAATLAADQAAYSAAGRKIGRTIGVAAAGFIAFEVGRKLNELIGGGPADIAGASLDAKTAVDSNRQVQIARGLGHDPMTRRAVRRWQRAHPGMDVGHSSAAQLAAAGYPGLVPGAPGVPKGYKPVVSDATASRLQIPHITVISVLDGREVARSVVTTAARDHAFRGR